MKIKGIKYQSEVFENGYLKELLVRCKYLLYKFKDDWKMNQDKRSSILLNNVHH
jgi:hypothetical protein